MFNHRMFSSGVALAALMAAAFGGCKDSTGPGEPPPPPEPSVSSVSITPSTGNVLSGENLQFTPTVNCINGECNRALRWYINGVLAGDTSLGTIASGLYTAPSRYCVDADLAVQVRAVSVADTTKSASASITVREPPMGPSPRLCWTRWLNGGAFTDVAVDPQDNLVVVGNPLAGYDASGALRWTTPISLYADVVVRDPADNGFFFSGNGYCGKVRGVDGGIVIDPASHMFSPVGVKSMQLAHSMLYVASLEGYVARFNLACDLADTLSVVFQGQGTLSSMAVNGTHHLVAYTAMVGGVNSNISSFLEKRTDSGLTWRLRYPDVLTPHVIESPSGEIYFVGLEYDANTFARVFVAKYDQAGNEIWRVYGDGTPPQQGYSSGVLKPVFSREGGVLVLFGLNAVKNIWLLDQSGQTRWKVRHDIAGDDLPGGMAFNSRGELIVVGNNPSSSRGYITRWRLP